MKTYGEIPGEPIGSLFEDRAALHAAGVHGPLGLPVMWVAGWLPAVHYGVLTEMASVSDLGQHHPRVPARHFCTTARVIITMAGSEFE